MPKHITVNGVPWCQACSRPATFGLNPEAPDAVDLMLAKYSGLQRSAQAEGLFILCMDSHPSNEAAVEFLRKRGLNATLTDGVCPTLED